MKFNFRVTPIIFLDVLEKWNSSLVWKCRSDIFNFKLGISIHLYKAIDHLRQNIFWRFGKTPHVVSFKVRSDEYKVNVVHREGVIVINVAILPLLDGRFCCEKYLSGCHIRYYLNFSYQLKKRFKEANLFMLWHKTKKNYKIPQEDMKRCEESLVGYD